MQNKNITPDFYNYVPSSNTISYYKFEDNLNDSSGNSRNFSQKSGTAFTYGTIGNLRYVNITQNNWTHGVSTPYTVQNYTRNFWLKFPYYSKTSSGSYGILMDYWRGSSYGVSRIENKNGIFVCDGISFTPPDYDKWYNYCLVNNNGSTKLYVNAELKGTGTTGLNTSTTSVTLALNNAPDTNGSQYAGQGYLAMRINENYNWTEQLIQKHFRKYKSNFGY